MLHISVCPSGFARAAAMMPTAPTPWFWLSTTTLWPSRSTSFAASARAMTSAPLPGPEGTIIRTGRSGRHSACAVAARAAGALPIAPNKGRRPNLLCIEPLPEVVLTPK